MDKICCNCLNLQTHVEPVAPGEGIIIHKCKITNQEVKWNDACKIANFIPKSCPKNNKSWQNT